MKSSHKFWSFIGDNVLSLLSVAIGMIALVLLGLGIASTDMIAVATLTIVAFLATSQVVERNRRLARLESKLEHTVEECRAGFDGYAVRQIPARDAHEYLRYRILTSRKSITWASIGPRRSTPSAAAKRPYEDALDQVAHRGEVIIRWIATLDHEPRVRRAQRLVFTEGDLSNIFVNYLPANLVQLPQFAFVIIDDEELIVRAPLAEGGRIDYMIISSSSIVALFLDYFDRLWEKANRLDKSDETRRFLDQVPH